jgi:hypothetical protein
VGELGWDERSDVLTVRMAAVASVMAWAARHNAITLVARLSLAL